MMITPMMFSDLSRAEDISSILNSALDAADPAMAVNQYLISTKFAFLKQQDNKNAKIFIIGAGKASYGMATAVSNFLHDHISNSRIIVKHPPEESTSLSLKWSLGGHPVPTDASLESTLELLKVVENLEETDQVFCVISGGGSALMTKPAAGISLSEIQSMTSRLLSCGACIQEINVLRKHLDEIKGGGLARAVQPAKMITLILSDVIGNPLDIIASGPTVGDPSTFQDAWNIIKKYGLESSLPNVIHEHFLAGLRGKIPETIKPGNEILKNVTNVLVGSNEQSVQAASDMAIDLGFDAQILSTTISGEAGRVGSELAKELKNRLKKRKSLKPLCLIGGGETTVTIKGKGLGGRNLEVALGAVRELKDLPNSVMITLATDGEDGPTDAAGACVTENTFEKARSLGLEPEQFLKDNNSYYFFQQAGGLIKTGVTGTNVNDLMFLFAF